MCIDLHIKNLLENGLDIFFCIILALMCLIPCYHCSFTLTDVFLGLLWNVLTPLLVITASYI